MNTLRLLVVFFRVSVLNETAYRVNFFLQLFQSLLELGTALAGLAVIFSFTNSLGGWSPNEMLALVGVYFLVGGIISLVIQPGMSALIEFGPGWDAGFHPDQAGGCPAAGEHPARGHLEPARTC